ncbi:hypothetical protein NGRA_2793 [Nosema granulosis]|uniref:Uncharacterized protein n=1 Tax=Nosema granulosis TaxID=83296 RepID=A0A9P6GWQ8_9MICR|nr:hypothetical protein NGRA_2793 [Nosema granulosis]
MVKFDIKIKHNRPELVVLDKSNKEILIVDVDITSSENLQQVETEKSKKYYILANELSQILWIQNMYNFLCANVDGVVTIYHDNHRRRLGIFNRIDGLYPISCFNDS